MNSITHLEIVSRQIISRHSIADVWVDKTNNHYSLHAAIEFNAGEIIIDFKASMIQSFATYLTLQTGIDKHITLEPSFLQYINHSCDPNVFFDTAEMKLVCLKSIKKREELGFFYPSTEWEMAQPFVCRCGNNNCLQLINGAAHLSLETLKKYRLSEFILQKI